ncbi:MAG: ABC transporter ATP-binding protein [Limnochordales bacterium]|nr:ABC transporter ATP-binding protein [Limnochordales bacterium]
MQPAGRRPFVDLLWFVGVAIRAAPLPTTLWAAAALAMGGFVPIQLFLTKRLVDELAVRVSGRGEATPWLWLSLLVAILVLQELVSAFSQLVQVLAREQIGPKLQEQVMATTAGLDLATFENQAYYDQINRVLSDTESRAPATIANVVQLIRTLPALGGYTVVLATLSPALFAIILAGMVPTLLDAVASGQRAWSLFSEQTRDRRLAEFYAEMLTDRRYAKEVRIYGLAPYALGKWSTLFWKNSNAQRRLALRLLLRQRVTILVDAAASMLGLWWVVTAGLAKATAGSYAVLFQSVTGLSGAALGLVYAVKNLSTQAGFAAEFRSFLRQPLLYDSMPVSTSNVSIVSTPKDSLPEVARFPGRGSDDASGWYGQRNSHGRSFPTPLTQEIRAEDLWFTYPGADRPAIAGVSFTIRAGETVALVGENGAGKTTLVKLLLGLYRPDRGRILFDGVPADEIDPRSRFAAMSAIFQDFLRYALTFRENLAASNLGALRDDARLQGAVSAAGLDDLLARLPQGLDTLLGPEVGGVDLSGGEWQRVALARSLLREAQVLILDEPTAALDPLAELALFERFAELARGRATLLISHRLGMARLANRILVLEGGRLVEEGSHSDLVRRGGRYAQLFAAQARWYV